MQPVVGKIKFQFLIIGFIVITHELEILARLTHTTGKLLRRIGGTEHKHPLGSRSVHLPHRIITADAVFLYQSYQGGTHSTLVLWHIGFLL